MIRYAWEELTTRAGVKECVANIHCDGIPVVYGKASDISLTDPGIIIEPAAENAFWQIVKAEEDTLRWVNATDLMPSSSMWHGTRTPILFFGENTEQECSKTVEVLEDGSVVFHTDLIAATVFMLSRWEEIFVGERDLHNRFPATASVAYKQKFLDRPIIDEYAQILRAWLKHLRPDWQPNRSQFSVKLSHDVDTIKQYASVQEGFRHTASMLLKRRDLLQAWGIQKRLLSELLSPNDTSAMSGIRLLAAHNEQANFLGAFYFMGAAYSDFDSGYDPASTVVKKCVRSLASSGHEIGFHPGYTTFDNVTKLGAEKELLAEAFAQVSNEPIRGGRQHYLRFKAPATWRHWVEVGMQYDSTLGYADQEGFRCGTCHPFRVFDYEVDTELALTELPLIVMENTLRTYRKMDIDEAHRRIIQLAKRCRAVDGTFTLLWHNTSLFGSWSAWGDRYPQVIHELGTLVNER